MKRTVLAFLLCTFTAMTLAGCGKEISNDKITINQYKGLEVKKVIPLEVTEEDVEMSIQSTLETKAIRSEVTDRAVQTGDVVTMDYLGKVDGVAFDGGTAEGAELEIGSGQFIDGFEDALIGHTLGEVFDINVTFPENYGGDLSGKDAVFTITLHKIEEVQIPELTEEILPELSKTATTIEEYKQETREYLEQSNADTAKSELEQVVWQALIENCVIEEYPEDVLKEQMDAITEQYSFVETYYGMEVDEFLQQVYGITTEEMAKNLIKQEFAVELIAEKEGLTLTLEEYEAGLQEYATQYGYDDPREFEELYGEDVMKDVLLQKSVCDWLIANCKQVEE